MPIGNASIKRATGAIEKPAEKATKNVFKAEVALSDIEIAKIKCEEGQEVPAALKKSVKKFGVLHPVFVLCEGDSFTLVSGKARLQAAKENGLTTVKAVILTLEGTGSKEAKKDISIRYGEQNTPAAETEEKVSDIHEEKFNAIRSIGSKLPSYLL